MDQDSYDSESSCSGNSLSIEDSFNFIESGESEVSITLLAASEMISEWKREVRWWLIQYFCDSSVKPFCAIKDHHLHVCTCLNLNHKWEQVGYIVLSA